MKLLYVTTYYKPAYVYGGPVRSASQLCEALVSLGATVRVLTTNVNGKDLLDVPLGQPVNVDGVEVYYYPILSSLPHTLFYSPALVSACRKEAGQYDLAVLDVLFTHALGPAAAVCQKAGIPYIIPLHGQLLPWALRQKQAKKRLYLALAGNACLKQAAAIHCTAPVEARALTQLFGPMPHFIVPNGINCRRFSHLPHFGALRKRFNIPAHALVLLFMGRIHPVKRPDIAIEALAAARHMNDDVHLLLAGPDEVDGIPRLQLQAQKLGCLDRVHFVGLLQGDDILTALADADLFLMPSESENSGIAAFEAMAAGLPVLLSEGVPVGPWADQAQAGKLVPCTAEAFRQATCELLASPGRLKEMGRRGQALVRERFEISRVARLMLSQYEAILANGRPLPEGDFSPA